MPPHFVKKLNEKMIKYILSQKDPEFLEAFTIFKSDENQQECLDYLQAAMKNNSQKIALSTFMEMYNASKGNVTTVTEERQK